MTRIKSIYLALLTFFFLPMAASADPIEFHLEGSFDNFGCRDVLDPFETDPEFCGPFSGIFTIDSTDTSPFDDRGVYALLSGSITYSDGFVDTLNPLRSGLVVSTEVTTAGSYIEVFLDLVGSRGLGTYFGSDDPNTIDPNDFNSVAAALPATLFWSSGPAGFWCGRGCGGPVSFTRRNATVPEPGTLTLLGLGLAGIGFAKRKRT